MKKYSYLLLVFCSISVFAQKNKEVKAIDLFKSKSYVKAAEAYEKEEKTGEVLQNLGDCYYYNNQMDNAVKTYSEFFSNFQDSVKKETYFRYANALKGVKDYQKGDSIMSHYFGEEQNTNKFMKTVTRNSSVAYKVVKVSKSEDGDFGVSYFGDKIVFSSSRNGGSIYKWNNKPYLDLFSATVDENGELEKIEPFPEMINSKNHESSATFSEDGNTMYFDRTNAKRVNVGDEIFASIKIYKAELKDGKWTNVEAVPFSSDTYSVEHPFLTKDGKKLYFASDMPGSIGSMDIYVVDIQDDGTYSSPRNLGDKINTYHREQFPFIAEDGTLYFGSDGHQGCGNIDIFKCKKINEEEFDNPVNLGSSINSEMDDFNFVIDTTGSKGYFSSNRSGEDNLYSFSVEKNNLQYLVEGEVKDKKTSEVLPGAVVKLYNDKGDLIEEIPVEKDGTFIFNTEPNKGYKLMAFKDFYIPAEYTFETSETDKVYLDLEMKVESYNDAEEIITSGEGGELFIQLENIYFDTDKSDIKPQATKVLDGLVDILKKYPYMEIQIGAHTDSRASASYNLRLSNRRADAALEYLVEKGIDKNRLRSIGYGETKPLIICPNEDCTEEENAINRRSTFRILK